MSFCVVLITAPGLPEARRISRMLVSERLAACVNIVRGIESLFRWKGKVDRAKEFLLIVKTRKSLVKRLGLAVKKIHSYSVCEVIALPVLAGNRDYLSWIAASCRKG